LPISHVSFISRVYRNVVRLITGAALVAEPGILQIERLPRLMVACGLRLEPICIVEGPSSKQSSRSRLRSYKIYSVNPPLLSGTFTRDPDISSNTRRFRVIPNTVL